MTKWYKTDQDDEKIRLKQVVEFSCYTDDEADKVADLAVGESVTFPETAESFALTVTRLPDE